MHRALLSLPLLLAACAAVPPPQAPSPSFAAALASICDVDRLGHLAADGDPLGIGVQRTAWIAQHADDPDAIELRTRMSVKGPAEQGEMLRAQALAAGLARCQLADDLEKTGLGGLSP